MEIALKNLNVNSPNIGNTKGSAKLDWESFSSTLIIEVARDSKVFTSTAVVIGRNMLLTAAHSIDCFDGGRVLLGENYHTAKESIKVKKSIIHPEYNPSKSFFENDLAIVILEHNLPKNIKIESIKEDIALAPGDILDRVGFGERNNQNIRTWTNPTFKERTFNKKNYILKDERSVIGDSGGPIFKRQNGQTSLVGIHSTLEGADKTYIVNISPYISWIESNRTLRKLV
jgi:secreted trypsin-like serine protease